MDLGTKEYDLDFKWSRKQAFRDIQSSMSAVEEHSKNVEETFPLHKYSNQTSFMTVTKQSANFVRASIGVRNNIMRRYTCP